MKDFKISIGAVLDTNVPKQIQGQLSNIKGLELKIDKIDTSGITSSIEKSIQQAFKNIPSVPLGGGGGNKNSSTSVNQIEKIQKALNAKTYETNITILENKFKKFGLTAGDIEVKLKDVKTALSQININDPTDKLIANVEKYQTELQKVTNEFKSLASIEIKPEQKISLSNKMEGWLQKNTAATKDFGGQIRILMEELKTCDSIRFNGIKNEFQNIQNQARITGKLGKSFSDTFKGLTSTFSMWVGTTNIIMNVFGSVINGVAELKSLNSILTEISKTSNLTTSQLKELGNTSFDKASKFGRTASDYLTAVTEMSRSGYYGKQGESMAQLSLLAQSAGDMQADVANSYLLATNAAYEYAGSAEKLNAVLDGQNVITNRNSVDMNTMAAATEKAGSIASQYDVAIENLSAMIGTISASTKQSGEEVGTGIKALLINLQNITSDKIVDTLSAANASMTEMKDGVEQMRNPIDILKDLAKTFNSLDKKDPLRSEILTNIGQKYHANQLSALLQNFDQYEKMLFDYSEGSGSAMEEAKKSANNWEGSLNSLSNTWTSLINNIADSDGIVAGIKALDGLLKQVVKLSDFLGTFGSIGVLGGLFASIKDVGRRKMFSLTLNMPTVMVFSCEV